MSPEKSLLTEESSATAWDSNVPPLLILAAFRITWTAIDDDLCDFFLMSSMHFRREDEEGAGLDREYWERVNQVRSSSQPKSFLWSQLKEVF